MDRALRRKIFFNKFNKRKKLWHHITGVDTSNWYRLQNHCKSYPSRRANNIEKIYNATKKRWSRKHKKEIIKTELNLI